MLEKLTHPRVFIYDKEKIYEGASEVNWKLNKRFLKYPDELENETGFLRALSPCFSVYIDLDKAENQFVIKDTFTTEEKCRISKDLMDSKTMNVKEIMNRFCWIDKNTIRIISKDGVEKLIDLSNN